MEPPRPFSWTESLGRSSPQLWTRIAALAGLSVVLGLAFNAANPIGVRWGVAGSSAALVGTPVREATVPAAASAVSPASVPVIPPGGLAGGEGLDASTAGSSGSLEAKYPTVSWPETKSLLSAGKIVLVDARGTPTYEAGHIPGAISLPEMSTVGEFRAFAVRQPSSTSLVIYCGNSACDASAKLAEILTRDYAFKNVRLMSGGYAEYQRLELGYDPTPTRVSWSEVQPLLEQHKVLLVDARARAAFDAGHIPDAISLPEESPEDAFRDFQKKYPADAHVVVYCTDLRCSKSMRVAIKLATWYQFRKVQFMPGGYQEWQQAQPGAALPKI